MQYVLCQSQEKSIEREVKVFLDLFKALQRRLTIEPREVEHVCAQRLASQVKLGGIAGKGSQLKTDREMEKRKKKVEEMAGERRKEKGRIERKEIESDQNSRSWILNTLLLLDRILMRF